MKHSEWRVIAEDVNERIDKVAAKYEAELTRSRLQTLIDEGSLLVNGKPVKNNYKVKLDDFIELDFIDDAELDAPAENLNLDIVYEDSDVIVINKPRGWWFIHRLAISMALWSTVCFIIAPIFLESTVFCGRELCTASIRIRRAF